MRITELLTKNTIHLHLKSSQKAEVIEELVVQVLDVAGKLNDRAEYKQAIFHREEQSTTGIGEGRGDCHPPCKDSGG